MGEGEEKIRKEMKKLRNRIEILEVGCRK